MAKRKTNHPKGVINTQNHTPQKELTPKPMYPSAELLYNVCYDEYRHSLDSFDKVYEKINIALAFSGVILLVIMSSFDFTAVFQIKLHTPMIETILLWGIFIFSLASVILIVWAVVQLLMLMRSRTLTVLDSVSLCNDRWYYKTVETTLMWMIYVCAQTTSKVREQTKKKQRSFDNSVLKIVIALLCFAITIIMKGIKL